MLPSEVASMRQAGESESAAGHKGFACGEYTVYEKRELEFLSLINRLNRFHRLLSSKSSLYSNLFRILSFLSIGINSIVNIRMWDIGGREAV